MNFTGRLFFLVIFFNSQLTPLYCIANERLLKNIIQRCCNHELCNKITNEKKEKRRQKIKIALIHIGRLISSIATILQDPHDSERVGAHVAQLATNMVDFSFQMTKKFHEASLFSREELVQMAEELIEKYSYNTNQKLLNKLSRLE